MGNCKSAIFESVTLSDVMSIRLFNLLFVAISLAMLQAQAIYPQTRPASHPAVAHRSSAENDSRPAEIAALKGDTLSSIAERLRLRVEELERLNGFSAHTRLRKGQRVLLSSPSASNPGERRQAIGFRISFADGGTLDVEEAWRQGSTVWYRRGGVGQSLDREVRSIDPLFGPVPRLEKGNLQRGLEAEADRTPAKHPSVWIYLVGGARFKVDDVREGSDGAWYNRGNVSIFLEKARIARIERLEETPFGARKDVEWTSGNAKIDELIRTNGARYGVDPYLVFCVIEHESHFRPRALSPKGAQGLMQLMPGTARRFGVSRPYDVAENIKGGTQYLKELMTMFGGRVNLVLASYNAGEGAVLKYGRSIPPYKETRDYVKKIGKRYGIDGREPSPDNDIPSPRQ
jgi:hypothetical protein